MPQAQTIDPRALADALVLLIGEKAAKAVSSTPTGTYAHGPNGLLSTRGMSRPVISAMLLPRLGLQAALPLRPSNESNPLYGIFTGVTATTGEEPTGVCDDPPTAGLKKLCTHQFVFGRMARQTRVFDLDRMGLVVNRADFTDYQFVGNPWQPPTPITTPAVPGVGAGAMDQVLNAEAANALFELAVAMSRDFATDTYVGNPTNNTAGGGRKYFYGLDILINTGYRDAETGNACPAADSIVRSAGNREVSTNGSYYVRQITNLYRNLRYIAANAGLEPATWAIAMRWSLFYELTEVWPCAYHVYRCGSDFTAAQNQITDSQRMIDLRDQMRGDLYNRTGQYLLIDGQHVPVIIDDGIAETVVAGASFRSPIYFVPLTIVGGMPVTFWEHLNYDAPNGAMEAARVLAPDGVFYTTDGGRFLWIKKPPTNYCVQVQVKVEPRLMLLTPHIAARLTDVQYTPVAHERSPFPSDMSFFVDGGRTDGGGQGPSYYTP